MLYLFSEISSQSFPRSIGGMPLYSSFKTYYDFLIVFQFGSNLVFQISFYFAYSIFFA